MDDQASSSSAECAPGNSGDATDGEIQWRFSQIKGNIETDDSPTDGKNLLVIVVGSLVDRECDYPR